MGSREKYVLHGIYADLITQYLEYKRSLGYKMAGYEFSFAVFDRLTIERGETKIGISKDLFEAFGERTSWESESNRYFRIGMLKVFSEYLRLLDYDSYIPPLPRYKSDFTPYIFTKEQLNKIYREADKLHDPHVRMDSIVSALPALLRFLGGSGPRLDEALKVKHSDLDLDNNAVLLHTGKNGEDRLISISKSLRAVLLDYCLFKENMGVPCSPNDFLFTSLDGKVISGNTVYCHFRLILHRAGIPHMGRGCGPRLHDLRHTFCVNALVAMSEADMDLYTSLPILMRYVGHKKLSSTDRYVRITEEMFPNLINKVNEFYGYLLPELDPETFENDYDDKDD